jgi:hypothetical protein
MKPSHEELNYRGKSVRQHLDQGAEERLVSPTTSSFWLDESSIPPLIWISTLTFFLVLVRQRAFMKSVGFDINSPNASMCTQSFTQKMWETIVQEKASTNESFRCAACGTRPAAKKSAQVLNEVVAEPSGSWFYKVQLIPCFAVCDKGKCHLLAQKVGGRITDVAVAKGATSTIGAAVNTFTGGRSNHTANFPATNTHFTCENVPKKQGSHAPVYASELLFRCVS